MYVTDAIAKFTICHQLWILDTVEIRHHFADDRAWVQLIFGVYRCVIVNTRTPTLFFPQLRVYFLLSLLLLYYFVHILKNLFTVRILLFSPFLFLFKLLNCYYRLSVIFYSFHIEKKNYVQLNHWTVLSK